MNQASVAKKAIEYRRKLSVPLDGAVCGFEAVIRAGFDLRFLSLDSLEGCYFRSVPPCIVVTSDRPVMRQRFTAIHELAHDILGHFSHFNPASPLSSPFRWKTWQENQANFFAANFLMPPVVVKQFWSSGKSRRGPADVFGMACALGVGYETLLTHSHYALRAIESKEFDLLKRHRLRQIQKQLGVDPAVRQLLYVNSSWIGRSLDVPVGTHVLASNEVALASPLVRSIDRMSTGVLGIAEEIGVSGSLETPNGKVAVRVHRYPLVGRGVYRFEELP